MRDERGRFISGNPGDPGRLPRVTEDDYLVALRREVSPAAWRAIVQRAMADAKKGHASACE